MGTLTRKHTLIYEEGRPAFVVVPYGDYQDLIGEQTTIPNDVVNLIDKHNCNLLGAWRRFRGLTQKEFAERMGITQPAVANMERVDNPHGATIEKAAIILDCDESQLTD